MGSAEHLQIDGGKRHGGHQIGDKYQLLGEVAVPAAAAAGRNVTDELAEKRGDDAAQNRQLDGVHQRLKEGLVPEDPGIVDGGGRVGQLARPVIQGQVGRAVAGAGFYLESLHHQDEHGCPGG